MNLADIKKARETEAARVRGSTVLVWGPSKSGKTRWVSTMAKSPAIKRVFLWDLENGFETILYATNGDGTPYLSSEELSKIHLIQVTDTTDRPLGAETLLKVFSNPRGYTGINASDGKVIWQGSKKKDTQCDVLIGPEDWGPETCHIVDTISQLGISALNLAKIDMGEVKDQRRLYQHANINLNNFFTMVQASNAFIICVTHVLTDEVVLSRDKSGNPTNTRTDYYPQCLSKNFSINVGSSFGSVIYKYIDGFSFAHVSTPTKKRGIQAGTRTNIDISSNLEATLPELLKLSDVSPAEAKPTKSSLIDKLNGR